MKVADGIMAYDCEGRIFCVTCAAKVHEFKRVGVTDTELTETEDGWIAFFGVEDNYLGEVCENCGDLIREIEGRVANSPEEYVYPSDDEMTQIFQ